MALVVQGSLLDVGREMAFGHLGTGVVRHRLALGAWVDVRPGWLAGGDELLTALLGEVPWRAERRRMYDSVVDVPRLTKFYDRDEALPHPMVEAARAALSAWYEAELGEPFASAGLCLYRDGRDSVAWHGDRIGRSAHTDTIVAILSLGASRVLALRPHPGRSVRGAPSVRFTMGHGDLLVMGGSCQRTWDHAVPKTARPVGPRVSVQFRVAGVR